MANYTGALTHCASLDNGRLWTDLELKSGVCCGICDSDSSLTWHNGKQNLPTKNAISQKKLDLFDFTSFFGSTFFKFSGLLCTKATRSSETPSKKTDWHQ